MSQTVPLPRTTRHAVRALSLLCLSLPLAFAAQAQPGARFLVHPPARAALVPAVAHGPAHGGVIAVRGGGGHGAWRGGGGGRSWHSGGGWHHHRPHPGAFVRYGLPAFATVLTVGALTYYVANDVYYRPLPDGRYEVVPNPLQDPSAALERPFVYPRQVQTAEQQATDEYECHRWAVSQSGYDPTLELTTGATAMGEAPRQSYQRATGVCLDGRGYSVR